MTQLKFSIKVILLSLSIITFQNIANECAVAPPFVLIDKAEENVINLQSMQPYLSENDTPTLINFWAVWCAPCRTELPLLNKLGNDTGITIQLVNIGDDADKVSKLLTELEVDGLPSILADSTLFSELDLVGLPASVVVDGNDIYVGFGKLKNEKALSNWLTCLQSN